MHLLFAETFPEGDERGDKTWNYDWFTENTGSKWAPEVHFCESRSDKITFLGYDTAWTPNNGTLQRLHDKTGWKICNEYTEEGMQSHGRLTCENGEFDDEELEYLTSCEICEEGKPDDEYDEELDGLICNECRRKAKIIS